MPHFSSVGRSIHVCPYHVFGSKSSAGQEFQRGSGQVFEEFQVLQEWQNGKGILKYHSIYVTACPICLFMSTFYVDTIRSTLP